MWSTGSHQSSSSASGDHSGDKPSTINNRVHGKKGKVKFPYKLCEGNHPIHLCPLLDEASKELKNLTTSQPILPVGYQKISLDPLLVNQVIDEKPSFVNPDLFEVSLVIPFSTCHWLRKW